MGLFLIFKFIVFTTSFFKGSSAAVQVPGWQSPMPGTIPWSVPGWHEEQLVEVLPSLPVCQDTPEQTLPVSQAFLLPLHWPPFSGREELKPFEQEPQAHGSFFPRLGQEPSHSWICPCPARWRQELALWKLVSPESREAGEAHKSRRG